MAKQPKLLLVDDREDNLLSMETILESSGYQFVKARSGRQTLKILLTEMDFALILMDVNMPELNGFETASLIYEREKLKHIPIIFITAHDYGEESLFEGYRAGAVDYIYKPVKPDLLRAKVAVFVELYMKKAQLIAQEQKLMAINKSLELEISDRKASEEKITELNMQLVQNVSRLEAANKELDLFAFMASHDLQAPVRKIRTFSDRLLAGYGDQLDEHGRMYLDRIEKVCSQMQQLINDILEFSKITVKKELFQQVDLSHLIGEILTELDGGIQEKHIRMMVEKIPLLCVNAVLMRQLFLNLISNAVKYIGNIPDPRIHIYSETVNLNKVVDGKRQNLKYCRIFVEDNGIGFDQKYAKEIFDMFRRLHPSNEYEGTGIGLALCKKIVEKHNGFISVKSKIDKGSTFVISLPVDHPFGDS